MTTSKLSILFATLLLGGATAGLARAETVVDMYKNPYCSCCEKWVQHMSKAGFTVKVHSVEDVTGTRHQLGMPDKLASCHTAKVDGYVLEGHVPASDVQRLLKEKPKALGLAVPGMPAGSPGMDIPNSPPYETLLVQKDGGSTVFAKH